MAVSLGNFVSGSTTSGSVSVTLTLRPEDDAIVAEVGRDAGGSTPSGFDVIFDPGGADEATFSEVVATAEDDTVAALHMLLDSDLPDISSNTDYTVQVSITDGNFNITTVGVRAVSGAEQALPSGTAINSAIGGVSSFSTDVEGVADGMAFDQVSLRQPESESVGADQTVEYAVEPSVASDHFASREPITSDGTVTMSWSWGSSAGEEAHAVMAIAPADTGDQTIGAPVATVDLEAPTPQIAPTTSVSAPVAPSVFESSPPAVAASVGLDAPVAAAELEAPAPTPDTSVDVLAPVAELLAEAAAPSVSTASDQTLSAPVAEALLEAVAPQVESSVSLSAPAGVVSLDAPTPSITVGTVLSAPVAEALLEATAPELVPGTATPEAPVAETILTAPEPQVAASVGVPAPVASVELDALPPSVQAAISFAAAGADVEATAQAPQVSPGTATPTVPVATVTVTVLDVTVLAGELFVNTVTGEVFIARSLSGDAKVARETEGDANIAQTLSGDVEV